MVFNWVYPSASSVCTRPQIFREKGIIILLRGKFTFLPLLRDRLWLIIESWDIAAQALQSYILVFSVLCSFLLTNIFKPCFLEPFCKSDIITGPFVDTNWLSICDTAFFDQVLRSVLAKHSCEVETKYIEELMCT